MFVTIRTNSTELVAAESNCASRQNVRFINKTNDVKKSGLSTEKYRDNVVSITAAIKSAEKLAARKVSKVEFIYPMLECI